MSNIYNFKLCRIVYKLKTKYMSTIEKLFTIVNNLKVGKGKLSITRSPFDGLLALLRKKLSKI